MTPTGGKEEGGGRRCTKTRGGGKKATKPDKASAGTAESVVEETQETPLAPEQRALMDFRTPRPGQLCSRAPPASFQLRKLSSELTSALR